VVSMTEVAEEEIAVDSWTVVEAEVIVEASKTVEEVEIEAEE